jgi:hypothetical protein
MATSTLGTSTSASIPVAVAFSHSAAALAPADKATIAQAIKDDLNPTHPISMNPSFDYNGMLFVPRRGFLKVFPGDWVGVDSRGWPILLSADTIANGNWVHNP